MPVRIQNPPRTFRPPVTPPFYEAYYNRTAQFFKSRYYQLYSKIPTTNQVWQASKSFALKHKVVLLSGFVLAATLALLEYYRRTRPEYPLAQFRTSLNFAKLILEVPTRDRVPPNVTLTFCIDISGSMSPDNRLGAVKRALTKVLDDAQGIANASPNSKIRLAIVTFDDKPATIVSGFQFESRRPDESIKTSVQNLTVGGNTKILIGLEQATVELEKMAKKDPTASHTLVLLSDGVDERALTEYKSVLEKLTAAKTHLFAIGIGDGHDQKTLKGIVGIDQKNPPIKGEYIDATKCGDAIEKAIKEIYDAAVASFNSLEITSKQLAAGNWSVDGIPSAAKGDVTAYALANIAESGKRTHQIRIHVEQLPAPLDLSTVTFTLKFVDPKGRKGGLEFPWNPNTIADPEIIRG